MASLHERVQSLLLAEPAPDVLYYAVTLLLAENGAPTYTCFSGWVGHTTDSPRREIRQASLVHADRMLRSWRELGESGMVVNSIDDFGLFFAFGGNAVVEKRLAEQVVPEWLEPMVVANVGQFGFAALGALPAGALQRAPAPKHRMRVLQRDNYRCRVCGRSSNDHVDVELHVHHIRPWAVGGVTEDSNLITLCHTCHNGLDPHFKFSLYELLPGERNTDHRIQYQRQLHEYQAQVASRAKESDV
jgi:HNH endonuclease